MKFRAIEIAHPRWSAWVFPLAMFLIGGLVVLMIWLSWSVLIDSERSLLRRAQALLVLCAGAFGVYLLFENVRGWYAYWTRYKLTNSGIQVTHPDGRIDFVAWEDITCAIDKDWPPTVRLYCRRFGRPLMLLDPSIRKTSSGAFSRARAVVREKLGQRWKRRAA
jgi:hypothetical protein